MMVKNDKETIENDKETIEDTNEHEHGHENLIPVSLTTPA